MTINQALKKYYVEIMVAAAVGLGLWLGLKVVGPRFREEEVVENPRVEQAAMWVGEVEFLVEVRDDDRGRALGLSGREGLGKDEGMVFLYDKEVRPTFWMKDMLFDLDMVWIKDGKVVDVSEGVVAPTDMNPRIWTATPKETVDTVLEVVSGWVEENGVVVGDRVKLTGQLQ